MKITKTLKHTCVFFVFQIFLCVRFMKHAVCGHIFTYRHTKLDQECWFGEQYSNLPTEFARNAKRGAPKKQTGRPKISEKALSK